MFSLHVCRLASSSGSISYGERRRDGAVLHRPYITCDGTEEFLFDCDSLPIDECSRELSVYLVCLSKFSFLYRRYIVCSVAFFIASPSLYLSPPPLIRNDALTYIIEGRQSLDIDCRTERTFPPSTTIGYRSGDGIPANLTLPMCHTNEYIILTGSAEMCQSGNESVDFNVIDSSLDTGGEYQCVSCNSIGTEILNFRVEILGI